MESNEEPQMINNQAFVTLLHEHTILLNKSQSSVIKAEKEQALHSLRLKWEKLSGRLVTEAQVMKKINNMKTKLRAKLDLKRKGIKRIHLKQWEKEFHKLVNSLSGLTANSTVANRSEDQTAVSEDSELLTNVQSNTSPLPIPIEKSKTTLLETEETKNLSIPELHRLVLLEKLALLRLKREKLENLNLELVPMTAVPEGYTFAFRLA